MLCFPNCKINLGLFITERRSDGYHNLETIFYPVTLKDVLEIVPAKNETELFVAGKAVEGAKETNLVWKAYQLLKDRFPEKITALEIHLLKNIPMGAGLGGGSADGAFMLRLLNDFFRLNLSAEALSDFALKLGSDCPFFIYNKPQFARGRGEIMEPVNLDLSEYSVELICPKLPISTAKAFGMLSPAIAKIDLKTLPEIPVVDWRHVLHNDFEKPVFAEFPVLKEIKRQFYEQGALYASMTGSGSALYGILPKGYSVLIDVGLPFEEFYLR